jgi:hypothetical protein
MNEHHSQLLTTHVIPNYAHKFGKKKVLNIPVLQITPCYLSTTLSNSIGVTGVGDWFVMSRVGNILTLIYTIYYQTNAVAQLVQALRYKPESRGFDSRWCHWNFSLT